MKRNNEIGLVILNFNNYNLTIECVDSLLSYKLPIDIVIVDNHSKNESYSELKKYYSNSNVEIIETIENKGYAYGNNIGLRQLIRNNHNIKYLCIMNPDVEINNLNIFTNLANILNNYEDVAIVTGLMYIRNKLNLKNCFWKIPVGKEVAAQAFVKYERKEPIIYKDKNDIMKVDVVPGSFFMIKRDVYEKIGGLDEGTFLFEEENLLAIKIKKLGMTEAISFNDSYIHNHIKKKNNLSAILKKKTIGFNSRRYLAKKYYSISDRILLETVIMLNYIVIVLQYFYRKLKGTL